MDNNQILLVDTVVSFLDSTLESLVEGVSRIPSTVISAMESEADNTFKELDTLSSKMRDNPAALMEDEMVDRFLLRLDDMTDDFEACLKISST